ncbi:hypothetical protein GOQ04_05965 [Emticicia sp. ODNR4P]|nr:hypothetical protein [Emticicia sp. ODNR4P]
MTHVYLKKPQTILLILSNMALPKKTSNHNAHFEQYGFTEKSSNHTAQNEHYG